MKFKQHHQYHTKQFICHLDNKLLDGNHFRIVNECKKIARFIMDIIFVCIRVNGGQFQHSFNE